MRLLTENREVLDHISEYLYEHETITGKEFMKIFRELKGIPEPEDEAEKKTFFEQAEEARQELEEEKLPQRVRTWMMYCCAIRRIMRNSNVCN